MLTALREGWTTVLMHPDGLHLLPIHTGHMSPHFSLTFGLENAYALQRGDKRRRQSPSLSGSKGRQVDGEEHAANIDPENA